MLRRQLLKLLGVAESARLLKLKQRKTRRMMMRRKKMTPLTSRKKMRHHLLSEDEEDHLEVETVERRQDPSQRSLLDLVAEDPGPSLPRRRKSCLDLMGSLEDVEGPRRSRRRLVAGNLALNSC